LQVLEYLEAGVVDRSAQTTLEGLNDQDLVLSREMQGADLVQKSGDPPLIVNARLLWPKRAALCKATIAGLVVSLIVAVLIPNTYEASVQLMPPDNSSLSGSSAMLSLLAGAGGMGGSSGSSTGGGGLASSVGELLGGKSPGPLFIGILASRTLSDRIIDRFDLRRVYWIKTYVGTRRQLLSRVGFREDKKSGIISIVVEDRDRMRAYAMAQAYVEELNRLLAQVNTSSASREREFLEKRLTAINSELRDATKDLSEFSSRNATLDPQDQGKAMLDSAAVLEGQLIAAKSELSGLQQMYTDQNVRVRSLQAHISELDRQLNTFSGKSYTGATKLDPNSLYPSIRQLPVLGRQYAELYRRAKVDETVFELLTEAYEMAKVQEAKDTPSVKVLDASRIPERPSGPRLGWITIGGALLSFLIAVGWVLATDHWARVSPDEPYKAFLNHEILPSLRGGLTSVRGGWEQIRERIRHSV
jgi:hypothetical protein